MSRAALRDFLKREAKRDLEAASRRAAAALGVTVKRVSVRDQSSRWGSCSTTGVLSYSWRLILAPPFVLDYLAAHEVAHLVEMNHSRAFWRVVERICPDVARAKAWLDAHGAELHRYGLPSARGQRRGGLLVLRPDTFALTALLAALTAHRAAHRPTCICRRCRTSRASFDASTAQVQLTISAYLVGFAVGQICLRPDVRPPWPQAGAARRASRSIARRALPARCRPRSRC